MSKTRGRVAVAALVMTATLGAGTAVAGAAPPLVNQGGGLVEGASATLTDCPVVPAEVSCTATLINVEEPGIIFVDLLEIQLHPDGTFDFEFVDSGFTDSATVAIDLRAGVGSASGSVPMASGVIPVSVSWTATGPVVVFRPTDSFHDPCFTFQLHFRDRVRAATTSAVIDGIAQHGVDIPGVQPNQMFRSTGAFVDINRCLPEG